MTPVTNRYIKKEEHRGQKNTFLWRMKKLRREMKTFSRRIISMYSTRIRGPWKNLSFYSENKQIFKHI